MVDAQADVAAEGHHPVIPPGEGFLRLVEQPEGVGETEATNYQAYVYVDAAGQFGAFWEYGAGTNESIMSGVYLLPDVPYHLAVRKNGTANTVEFFVGGSKVATVAYTNEPSGGSSAVLRIGEDATGDTAPFWPAHYAWYNSLLSDARIMVHAAASQCFGDADSQSLGFKDIPLAESIGGTTLGLKHRGKFIATTGNITIPANSSVAFPIGTAVTIYNNSSSTVTVGITTDTLRLGGTANTGTRNLAQRGVCTVLKVAATEWVISGAGVT